MSTGDFNEPGLPTSPLTRSDVEQLLHREQSAGPVDLRLQNLQQCDLSYLNLEGANLRGANLQGASLRGTNLRQADLQEANLSEADLDGADLSGARLCGHEAHRAILRGAKLSYTTLRGLDLRGFDLSWLDLQGADLNGTDLRDAVLRGANLQGADLSTAQLRGPELRGAILHREEHWGSGRKQGSRNRTPVQSLSSASPRLIQTRPSPLSEPEQSRLSDREAFLMGEQVWALAAEPVQIHRLFPHGFTFAHARQLFDSWLAQAGTSYTVGEVQAIWIGFASRLCLLYHEQPPDA